MDFIIDLPILRAVAAVARTGSLTAAAAELHSSQSALSHLITKWERRHGIALLNRRQRPLTLTPAGALLAERATQVETLLSDTENALQALHQQEQARLFITLECHTCIEWLAPTLDRYRREHPHVHLDVRMGASFDPLPSLKAGSTDLVITAEQTNEGSARTSNLDSEHGKDFAADALFRYPVVALLRHDHPLAGKASLAPHDFSGQTVITYPVAECRLDLYTRFLDPAGIVPKERRTAELTTLIIQWASAGAGIAALPRWAVSQRPPELVMLPLSREGLWADLYAIRRQQDRHLSHLDAFIMHARQDCFERLESVVPVPTTSAQQETTK